MHLNNNTYYLLPTLRDTPPNRSVSGIRSIIADYFAHYCTSSGAITDMNPQADCGEYRRQQDYELPNLAVRLWCDYRLGEMGIEPEYTFIKAELPTWLSSRTLRNEEIKNLRIMTMTPESVEIDGEQVKTWLSQEFVDLFENQYYDFSDICGDSFTAEHNKQDSPLWNTSGPFVETAGPISIFPDSFKEAAATKMNNRVQSIKLRNLYRGPVGTKDPEWTIDSQTPAQIMSGNRIFLVKRKIKIMDPGRKRWISITVLVAGFFGSMTSILTMTRAKNFFSMLLNTQEQNHGLLRWMDPKAYKAIKNLTATEYDEYYSGYSLVGDAAAAKGNKKWASADDSSALSDSQTKILAMTEYIRTAPWGRARNTVLSRFKDKEAAIKKYKAQLENERVKIENLTKYSKDARYRITQLAANIALWEVDLANLVPKVQVAEQALIPKQASYSIMKQQFDQINNSFVQKLKEYTSEAKDKELPSMIEQFSNMNVEILDLTFYDSAGYVTDLDNITIEKYFKYSYTLQRVHFRTTKPMLMQIVNKKGVQIDTRVGGPWEVIVEKRALKAAPTVKIRLASTSSIRGIDPASEYSKGKYYWKPHPHVASCIARRTENNWQQASKYWVTDTCQGELAPNLITAFRSSNPKVVVYAMLTWLCAAYAEDPWGKSYKWWPKPEEVMIEGGWNTKQKQLMSDLEEHEYIGSVGTHIEVWTNDDRSYRFSHNGRTLVSETGTGAFLDQRMKVNKKRTQIFDSEEAVARRLVSRLKMLNTLGYKKIKEQDVTATLPAPPVQTPTTPASDDQYVPVSNIRF